VKAIVSLVTLASLLVIVLPGTHTRASIPPSSVIDSPHPSFNAGFGAPVALGNSDGDTLDELLIGAPYEDVGQNQKQGRAYLVDSTGSLLQAFDSPNGDSDGRFALGVAMGDVTGDGADEIIIAAPYEVSGLARPGRVYVFSASGSLLRTMTSPDTSNPVVFGLKIEVGDVDGDAIDDIFALTGDSPGYLGTAYIFSGASGSLIRALSNPNPQGGSYFGHGFAVGDITGEGLQDVAIGAFREDVGMNPDQGRVYLYSGANGALIRSLDLPMPQDFAQFGASLAIGRVNLDGFGDIVVGADYEDVSGNAFQGRAYIFSGGDGSLIRALDHPTPQPYGFFGAVATGDANGDDWGDVFVTANDGAYSKVYAFDGATGGHVDSLVPAVGQTGSAFGRDPHLGQLNADIDAELAIGAPLEDVGSNENQGRMYVFDPNSDADPYWNVSDNCPSVTNAGQENLDADALGDACDTDDDGDLVGDVDEGPCGSDPLDVTAPRSHPERVDGAFGGVDDDGDLAVDEGLPGGASGFDCDGDGWTGAQEEAVFDGSGGRDQDSCGGNGWPAELNSGVASENKVTLSDIGSFFSPVVYFNTSVGTNPGDERWDLIPNGMVQLQDVGALLAGMTAAPPMLGGVAAFNGPECPWPP
jgi:hypothetical protein